MKPVSGVLYVVIGAFRLLVGEVRMQREKGLAGAELESGLNHRE